MLWNFKISPVLEYGAPLWSSLISQNNISKIDSLQFQYFRKGLELPQATGRDALLTDLGIPRLSILFKSRRSRLLFEIHEKQRPDVVSRSYHKYKKCILNFNSKPRIFTKYFPANTKKKAIGKRTQWMQDNSQSIVCRRRKSPKHMIDISKRRCNSTNGFWNLYRSGKKWSARVQVRVFRPVSGFLDDVQTIFRNAQHTINRKITLAGHNRGFRAHTRRYFRKWPQREHLRVLQFSGKSQTYLFLHKGWYFDPLILSTTHPMMRHFRALRLGVSRLAAHAFHRVSLQTRNCPHCRCAETPEHFFFDCARFQVQRQKLTKAISPILRDLNCKLSISSVLGFFDFLCSKPREKQTRDSNTYWTICLPLTDF